MSTIKRSVFVFLLFLLLVSNVCAVGINISNPGEIKKTGEKVLDEFDKPLTQGTFATKAFSFLGFGNTLREVILSSLIFGIVVFFMYNLLTIASIFEVKWVNQVVAFGLAALITLSRANQLMNNLAMNIFIYLGTFGAIIQMIVTFLVFIAIIFLGPWAQLFIEKRKAQQRMVHAIEKGAKVRGVTKLGGMIGGQDE